MKIKAFFFDLDGTLMDSEIMWVYAVYDYMKDKKVVVDYSYVLDLVYGNSWEYIFEKLATDFPELQEDIPNLVRIVHPYFDRYAKEMPLAISGSVELLKTLARDYPCAIVSGSYREDVSKAIQLLGIEREVYFYLGKEDYHPQKPSPVCYLKAAEILEVKPAQCVVFEDSTVGITSAKGAGMYCVALACPDRPRQDVSNADLVLPDLSMFRLELIEKDCVKINDGKS